MCNPANHQSFSDLNSHALFVTPNPHPLTYTKLFWKLK